jgi:hypothetical protein
MKVLTAFSVSDAKRGYRRHECSKCQSDRHKRYYWANREERKKQTKSDWDVWGRKAYADLRTEILDTLGACCQCCGEMNPFFLAIDHADNDGAEDRRKNGGGLRGLRAIKRQIESGERRYQVLCHNCNTGKKLNGGVCPHKQGSTTIP